MTAARAKHTAATSSLPRLGLRCATGDLRAVNAQEADADLGSIIGDGHDGVPIAHALHGGDEGAGRGGVNGPQEGQKKNTNGDHGSANRAEEQP